METFLLAVAMSVYLGFNMAKRKAKTDMEKSRSKSTAAEETPRAKRAAAREVAKNSTDKDTKAVVKRAPAIKKPTLKSIAQADSLVLFVVKGARRDICVEKQMHAAYLAYTLDFWRTASDCKKNFVFSPLSIGAALSMLMEGAKGRTQREIASLLGKNSTPDEVSAFYQAVCKAISIDQESDSSGTCQIANAMFIDEGVPVEQQFVDDLTTRYEATIKAIDFNDKESAVEEVNEFVEQKTNGTIRDVVTASDFGNLNAAILVNSVHFEAPWLVHFEENYNRTMTFHGINGPRKEEFMCTDLFPCRYDIDEALKSISIYYENEYTLLIMMPSTDFIAWRDSFTSEKLLKIMEKLNKKKNKDADASFTFHLGWAFRTDLLINNFATIEIPARTAQFQIKMPKISIENSVDVAASLQKLGVRECFDGTADLSAISPSNDLYLNAIAQKAKITMDEKGTCASAATTESICAKGDKPTIKLNKPYLYAVIFSDVPVFIGHVV